MIATIKNGGLKRGAQAFFEHEAAGGIVLMAAAALAVLFSNSALAPLYDLLLSTPLAIQIGTFSLDKPLLLWINDGLMAIFFFLVGLEIKVACLRSEQPRCRLLPQRAACLGQRSFMSA